MIFIFVPKVFATDYMAVSNTSVKVGETFEVTVNFSGFKAWNIDVSTTDTDKVGSCVIDEEGMADAISDTQTFMVTCTALAAGTANLTLSGSLTTDSDEDHPQGIQTNLNESISINITEPVIDGPKGLANLQVTGGTLSPTFDSDNIQNPNYTITLNSSETSSFSIEATKKNNDDELTIQRENGSDYQQIAFGNIDFVTAGGNDTMLIRITVGKGERLVRYEITVVKPKPADIGLPELETLTINGQNIPLTSGEYEYDVILNDDVENYRINATLKDATNYKFDDYLVPPFESSSKEFQLKIVPKDLAAGLKSGEYVIRIKTNTIEPVTVTKEPTTKKQSGGYSDSDNPKTGSTSVYIVGFMLVASLMISMYLYKKNINGYN